MRIPGSFRQILVHLDQVKQISIQCQYKITAKVKRENRQSTTVTSNADYYHKFKIHTLGPQYILALPRSLKS